MKILLSAFACSPFTGSEGGVGWRYAVELGENHQVVVITDVTRRAAIEDALVKSRVHNVNFVYYRPCWLKRVPLNSYTAKLLFTAWQFSLLPFAQKLQRQYSFDVAWHLTYGVYRTPSFLGYLSIPFVFGPVGGGEDAPLKLKKSIHGREKVKELLRTLANKFATFNPLLFMALRKADAIFVRTNQTKNALPWPFRSETITIQEIGIEPHGLLTASTDRRTQGKPIEILFAGRLEGWKGVHLAIMAVAAACKRGINIRFNIVGTGPFESALKLLVMEQNISEQVVWVSKVPQRKLFEIYKHQHLFLFPSLHDSGGNVVLEAQSFGLPVICLDLGGPATLVDESSAVIIETGGKTEKEVVSSLADAIQLLANNEEKRLQLATGALRKAASQTWSARINQIAGLVEETVIKSQ
ncbi:glycosyltransferase [Desulfobacterota bacterium M19]